jgi:hypothetical protein
LYEWPTIQAEFSKCSPNILVDTRQHEFLPLRLLPYCRAVHQAAGRQ